MRHTRQIGKKISIWFAVISLLISTVFVAANTCQVMADESIEKAVQQMKEAAQIQLVSNVFSKCVRSSVDIAQKNVQDYYKDIFSPNNLFNLGGYKGSTTDIPVGAWLENQVQGKVNNGTIYCSDEDSNIVNLFASSMGISREELYCDGENPGLMKPYKHLDGGGYEEIQGQCSSLLGNDAITFRWNVEHKPNGDTSQINDYLKRLYNQKMGDNPYKVAWEDRGTFTDDMVNYYLYLSDFEQSCGQKDNSVTPEVAENNSDYFEIEQPVATDKGIKVETVYYKKYSKPKTDWKSNWINDKGAHTCDAVAERLSDTVDAVKTKLNTIVGSNMKAAMNQCQQNAVEVRLALVGRWAVATGEEKAALKERIDLLNKLYDQSVEELEKTDAQHITDAFKASIEELKNISANKVGNSKAPNQADTANTEDNFTWRINDEGGVVCRFDPNNPDAIDENTDAIYTPTDDAGGIDSGIGTIEGNPVGGNTPTCFNSASALGWILCPTMQIIGNATQAVYGYIENNFLQVKSDMYSSSSPAHNIWSTIRNWSNILFVIILLFVIFSQVTGLGLDNYGIKKVLPRLLMIVILTNVSFIICQLAIDLSNIVGSGINTLLGVDFANMITTDESFNLGKFLEGILPTLFTAGVAAGAGFIAVATWDKWLIPLLLFFIVAIIGVLFFGVMLAVREAAVIILAVLSPLAIVCYALPNTKNIYDRWFKMFSAMLILYPICGALMGGGIVASRLLLASAGSGDAGFFFQLVAVLVQIVPFFFIPGLVRSSMTAMGNLGARLSGWRDRVSHGATSAIRRSEAAKNFQQRTSALAARRRVRRYENNRDIRGKIGTWMNNRGMNGDRLLNSQGRTRDRARNAIIANQQFMDSQRALAQANRGLIQDNQARADAISTQYARQQEEEDVKAYMEQYAAAGTATDNAVMQHEYNDALQRLLIDANDQDARAKLLAAQRNLAKTDGGREIIQNALYGVSERLGTGASNAGLSHAANVLFREAGSDIKAKNRGFFNYLRDMQTAGSQLRGTFASDGHDGYTSSQYDNNGAGDYSAESLVNADENALHRLVNGMRNGQLSGSDRATLAASARAALSNPNLVNRQPKIARLLQQMANSDYLQDDSSRSAQSASDISTADAQRMANASSEDLHRIIDGMNNGTIATGAGREQIIHAVQRALDEAHAGSLQMRSGNAALLNQILSEAGQNTVDVDDSLKVPQGWRRAQLATPAGWGLDSSTGRWRDFSNPTSPVDLNAAQLDRLRQIQQINALNPGGVWQDSHGNTLSGNDLARAEAIERANAEASVLNLRNGHP